MKKAILSLIALAITAMASAFSFSATVASGQTLYFTVIGIDSVKVVAPATNWDGYTAPQGRLVIPASVTAEGETFQVKAIDKMAFQYCHALTSVSIPGSVVSIGQRAFYGDTLITSVHLGEGVESIGMMAFGSCTSLDTIELPSTLRLIAMSVFDNTAYFNDTLNWSSEMMLTLGQWVIKVGNRATDTVHVPEGIVGIANNAFLFCRYVEKVVLPSTLEIIGFGAFKDCFELDTLKLFADNPPSLEEDSFDGVTPLPVLVVPCGASQAYADIANHYWNAFSEVIEMPCPFPPLPQPHIAVEEVEADEALIVTVIQDGVLVRGAEGEALSVFDMTGRRVGHVACAQAEQRLLLPATGVYVLLPEDGNAVKIAYYSR